MILRAVFIANAHSRRGREWYAIIRDGLIEAGVDLAESHECRRPEEVFGRVSSAVAQKTPMILIGGGDGTLSSAASLIAPSESIMGVIPMGTGNAFARDLGIPAEPAAIVETITTGKVARVDLGYVSERFFVNVTTVGLSTRIAEEISDQSKRRFGRLTYAFAILRAITRARPFQASLTTDEDTFERETLQFVVSSGRYHAGPFAVTPEARITDRRLNGYLLGNSRRGALVRYAWSLVRGRQVDLPEVHAFSTKRGSLKTDPTMRVTIDGEVSEHTPIDFHVEERAIQVIVPQEFEG